MIRRLIAWLTGGTSAESERRRRELARDHHLAYFMTMCDDPMFLNGQFAAIVEPRRTEEPPHRAG